jgi:hypothetical protein
MGREYRVPLLEEMLLASDVALLASWWYCLIGRGHR